MFFTRIIEIAMKFILTEKYDKTATTLISHSDAVCETPFAASSNEEID